MTLDSFNKFCVTVTPQNVLWKLINLYSTLYVRRYSFNLIVTVILEWQDGTSMYIHCTHVFRCQWPEATLFPVWEIMHLIIYIVMYRDATHFYHQREATFVYSPKILLGEFPYIMTPWTCANFVNMQVVLCVYSKYYEVFLLWKDDVLWIIVNDWHHP